MPVETRETYLRNDTVAVEEITAGPSDNVIDATKYTIVDAGAGNDIVRGDRLDFAAEREERRADQFYLSTNTALFGNAGNDILIGQSGTDSLMGGAGDDLLNGGAGGDEYIVPTGAQGHDLIFDAGVLHTDIPDLGHRAPVGAKKIPGNILP